MKNDGVLGNIFGRGRHKPRGRSTGIEWPVRQMVDLGCQSEQSGWKGKLPMPSSNLRAAVVCLLPEGGPFRPEYCHRHACVPGPARYLLCANYTLASCPLRLRVNPHFISQPSPLSLLSHKPYTGHAPLCSGALVFTSPFHSHFCAPVWGHTA